MIHTKFIQCSITIKTLIIQCSIIKTLIIQFSRPYYSMLNYQDLNYPILKTLLSNSQLVYNLSSSEYELTTLLAEAESILNSRPLWPLHSTDPEDPLVLTAGHFLIGRPLKSPPTPGADLKTDVSKLKRWNLVRQLQHELWTTWKARYLQSLARSKWHRKNYNLKVGNIVMLKDDFPSQQR